MKTIRLLFNDEMARAILDRLAAAEAERDAMRAEVKKEASMRAEMAAEIKRLRARKAERCSRRIVWDDGCCPKWCTECGGSGAVFVEGEQ